MAEEQKKIRVLVADDSFFVRKLLSELLDADPEIEVVSEAKDGIEAIAEAARWKPDVITMDYKMPKMDGARATRRILELPEPTPIIIMVSAYTKEGAEETLECLRAGAVDFVSKPSGEISLDIEKVKEEIIAKVKGAARARVKKFKSLKTKAVKKGRRTSEKAGKAVIIGASTGGPPVVEDILAEFPPNIGVALLVVQHMPKYFTESSARRMGRISSLRVKEAAQGDVLNSGTCYIAPGGRQTTLVVKGTGSLSKILFRVTRESAERKPTPSIDISMKSVAEIFQANSVGVILTGMGNDGVAGMRAMKAFGGHTVVQDPETAVVDSMPRAVIEQGLADVIVPPSKITRHIVALCAQ